MRNPVNRRSRRQNQTVSYDSLEKKLPLTSFVVTTNLDVVDATDGLISLREAITAANTNAPFSDAVAGDATGDTITVSEDIRSIDFEETSDGFEITDDLAFNDMLIDATGLQDRLFSITTDESVSLNNLSIFKTDSGPSGAISATGGGDLLIDRTAISSFNVNGTLDGAAIFHDSGNLTITNSNFSRNETLGSGGAIYSASGNVTITDAEFTFNFAEISGGAIEIVDGVLEVSGSTFGLADDFGELSDNVQRGIGGLGGSGNFSGNGGAIHVSGNETRTVINNSSFTGNTASSEGGALWNQSGSIMIVRNSTLLDNVTQDSFLLTESANDDVAARIGNASGGGGGGIFNNSGRVFTRNVTLTGNGSVAGSGGGLFSAGGRVALNETTFTNNQASFSGGGIEVAGGRLEVLASTIEDSFSGRRCRATRL